MPAPSLLIIFLSQYRWLGYLIVFVGMMIEGDVLLFAAAFLAHTGFFEVGLLALVALVGSLVGDLGWYSLGHYHFVWLKRFYPWVERITRPFDTHLLNRPLRTLIVSKFTYGIYHVLLVRAGLLALPLKKFIKDDLVGIVIWILVIGGLGYFSGLYFTLVRHYLRYAEVGLLFALIGFFFFYHFISRLSRREL